MRNRPGTRSKETAAAVTWGASTMLFIPGCVRDRFLMEKPLDFDAACN